jgi:hypothetical protein
MASLSRRQRAPASASCRHKQAHLYSRTTPSLSSLGTNDALSRGSSTIDTSHASPGTARDLLHTCSRQQGWRSTKQRGSRREGGCPSSQTLPIQYVDSWTKATLPAPCRLPMPPPRDKMEHGTSPRQQWAGRGRTRKATCQHVRRVVQARHPVTQPSQHGVLGGADQIVQNNILTGAQQQHMRTQSDTQARSHSRDYW